MGGFTFGSNFEALDGLTNVTRRLVVEAFGDDLSNDIRVLRGGLIFLRGFGVFFNGKVLEALNATLVWTLCFLWRFFLSLSAASSGSASVSEEA